MPKKEKRLKNAVDKKEKQCKTAYYYLKLKLVWLERVSAISRCRFHNLLTISYMAYSWYKCGTGYYKQDIRNFTLEFVVCNAEFISSFA